MVGVVARAGGGRPSVGYRPRSTRPQRGRQIGNERDPDSPLINDEIRAPSVRLLGVDQSMIGVVPREEAMDLAREASLDLVMIASDADPPVVRIMDFSKYRYEQQKKKREAQKKAAASRVEVKELKMRYNIDVGDYNVRLKQAQKFLKDGDKVKASIQFRGREMEFKDLGFKLFKRFQEDLGEVAVLESRIQLEGRSISMLLGPNKAALQKVQAADQREKLKDKQAAKAVTETLDLAGVPDDEVDEGLKVKSGTLVVENERKPLVHENLLG